MGTTNGSVYDICRLQTAVCSLQSAVCSLQSVVCSLRSAVCKCHTPLTDSCFQIINSLRESFWGKLDLPWLLTLDFVCFLFYLKHQTVQTDASATGEANIGSLTALFTNMRTLEFKSRLHNCVFRCRPIIIMITRNEP